MPKLNQIIAVANGKKSHASGELTRVHQLLQKPALLEGISRTYRPRDEEGERLPSESKHIQLTVRQCIDTASEALAELFDVVATQDATNCQAKADVAVNGKLILTGVPVTTLLFLEKQLVDLHTFVEKLPTLDPGDTWEFDKATDTYRTPRHETVRTKKVPRNHVKAEATKEHPAQVDVYNEDIQVGTWETVKFSGAIPATQRREMLERVRRLQEAVKFAREQANSLDVVDVKAGKAVLEYIFNGSN